MFSRKLSPKNLTNNSKYFECSIAKKIDREQGFSFSRQVKDFEFLNTFFKALKR